ncbi:MAG: DUF58 domain-containing protein [Pirellulales bacterium]|nr:DUF58 domain-containing protein [Pirellulales bacterium]
MAHEIAQFLIDGQQAGARYALAAPRRAPQGTAGAQLGRLAGESMEFMDHREYQPGDDLRRLDWAAYARSDKMIVKLFRQEVSPHLDVVIDGSRSMDLPGGGKVRAAVGLAAALAAAAGNAGHTHRAFLTGRGCQPIVGGGESPSLWQGLKFDSPEAPPDSFRALPPAWRPRGIRVLISDLLWLDDPLLLLSALGDRAAAVHVIQVLAADDDAPPHRGNVRLVDSESDEVEEVFLDAAALARYRAKLQNHRENWRRAARQAGAAFVPLAAEVLCGAWDLSPLVEAGILTL